MRKTCIGSVPCYFYLFAVLLIFTACENPGNIGEDYIDKSELIFDTLTVGSTQNPEFIGYTGRLSRLAIGSFDDPLFGSITTASLIKPSINVTLPAEDSLDESYSLKLKLVFDKTVTYGDTLSAVNYSIHEVTSYWNGLHFKLNSDFTYDESTQLSSFSLTNEDSVIIDLPDSWRETYNQFVYADGTVSDSLLQYEFKGLAIVADENANRIIHPLISRSRFLAINDNTEPDTTEISLRDWAYSFSRENAAIPAETSVLHSTVENVIHFTLADFVPQIEGKNFIKAELIFHEAQEELENSLQVNEIRPAVTAVNIDVNYDSDAAHEFQFGQVEMPGSKNSSTNTFRINVTNHFNALIFGNDDKTDLYLGIGSNAGAIRSTLVYNENAPEALQPKLILTFLEEEN